MCTTGRRHLEHSNLWIIRKSNIHYDISLKEKSSSKESWEIGVITFEIGEKKEKEVHFSLEITKLINRTRTGFSITFLLTSSHNH